MTNRSIKKMPKTNKQFKDIRTERREAILDAALNVFAEQGYHAASISKVSKYAGISKGLMYNYFENKEELLKILIGSLLDNEMETMKSILSQPITEDSFKLLIHETSRILKEKPKQWKLYFSMASQPEVLQIAQDNYSPDQALFIEKLLQFFKNKGHKNPELQMQYFMSTLGGMKISYIMDPDNFPIDEIEQLIIKQFITT